MIAQKTSVMEGVLAKNKKKQKGLTTEEEQILQLPQVNKSTIYNTYMSASLSALVIRACYNEPL